jgi:hydroxysqualene synthase
MCLLLILQIYIFTLNNERFKAVPDKMNKKTLNRSYSEVISLARNHYENFPVASFLIPKKYRKDVAVIYWFARTADDIADEGDISPEERLNMLDKFEERFHSLMRGKFESDREKLLFNTIANRTLTPGYFTDLLSAFKQDVFKKRYSDYNDLLDYCRRSANPVGRLLLELFNVRREDAFIYSDYICTALQLTNFWQDAGIDLEKGRIYFPEEEMKSFGIDEKAFEIRENNDKLKQLVKYNIERTENLFSEGKKILPLLEGRFLLEIKWTIEGGRTVLQKIRKNDYNIFIRPNLTKSDFTGILLKCLFV